MMSFPSSRLCTKNTSRALIERPYSYAPQAVGAVYDRPGFFVQSPSSARRGMLYSAIHQETYIGSSHFLPALVAIVDPLAWIGVEPVVRGIVVAKFDVHPRSLRYLQRRSVGELPVEVVARNV